MEIGRGVSSTLFSPLHYLNYFTVTNTNCLDYSSRISTHYHCNQASRLKYLGIPYSFQYQVPLFYIQKYKQTIFILGLLYQSILDLQKFDRTDPLPPDPGVREYIPSKISPSCSSDSSYVQYLQHGVSPPSLLYTNWLGSPETKSTSHIFGLQGKSKGRYLFGFNIRLMELEEIREINILPLTLMGNKLKINMKLPICLVLILIHD